MKDNISPEEKLLKLIRREKKPAPRPAIPKYLISAYLKKLLWFSAAVSFIYLLTSFIYPWIGLRQIKLPDASPQKMGELSLKLKKEPKPYEFYAQAISQRQIFSNSASRESEREETAFNADLTKDINLIGIISGENPQAIIEDKKIQKTYYLNIGQFIREFQLKDIQEGKVILNYKGQKFELYL